MLPVRAFINISHVSFFDTKRIIIKIGAILGLSKSHNMAKRKKITFKVSEGGKLFISTKDLFERPEVQATMNKLMKSDLFKKIKTLKKNRELVNH